MSYVVITRKIWDSKNYTKLNKNIKVFNYIDLKNIKSINPKIIFFIHWSKYIPNFIYDRYLCIQFHASNLPKGKGGSPIQNQILAGISKSKISAFKISKKLDSGPLCMKENLSLLGNAEQIFKEIEKKSINMIGKLIKKKKIIFKKQIGKSSYFKRRKPFQSKINLKKIKTLKKLYDFIRMLDAPGYPNAYIELKDFRFTFNHVRRKKNLLETKVIIKK